MSTQLKRPLTTSASPLTISDSDLRQAILTRLGALAQQIEIQVERGDVYLRGNVLTAYEGQYLTRVIQQIAGVGAVRAVLRSGPPPVESNPARNDYSSLNEFGSWAAGHRSLAAGLGGLLLTLAIWSFWPFQSEDTFSLVDAPVSVRHENRFATGAFLTLHPLQTLRDGAGQDLTGLRPSGIVRPDGLVLWTTHQPNDGVPPGQYVVTAIWQRAIKVDGETIPGPNLFPEHLSNPRRSTLRLFIESNPVGDTPQSLTIVSRPPSPSRHF